jgi:hypothetical protein
MLAYLNMNSRVTLGKVLLQNVSEFETSEGVLEFSGTAKITIPKNYGKLQGQAILSQFKVGDKVKIEAGYNGEYNTEFVGYITTINTDAPLVIECEDESYILRNTNFVKSYKNATLKQILTDITKGTGLKFSCPDVNIGKFQIDNASAYEVLTVIQTEYGLYSRVSEGHLRVGLAYDYYKGGKHHEYVIGQNVRQNDLKYRTKEDLKIRFKAIALNPNGTRTKATVGYIGKDGSERTLHFAGPMTEAQLKETAKAYLSKVSFDGYQGSITGFGAPLTHAGDVLAVKDRLEPDNNYRDSSYFIEKVEISYNESSGFSRQNTLSYKI